MENTNTPIPEQAPEPASQPIQPVETNQVGQQAQAVKPPVVPTPGAKKTNKILWIVLGAIVLAVIAVIAFMSNEALKANRVAKERADKVLNQAKEAEKTDTASSASPTGNAVTVDTPCYNIKVDESLLNEGKTLRTDNSYCSGYIGSSFTSDSTGYGSVDEAEAGTKLGKTASEETKEKKRITVNGKQALWVYKQTRNGPDGVYDGDEIITVTIDAGKKYNIGDQVLRKMFNLRFYGVNIPEDTEKINAVLNGIVWK